MNFINLCHQSMPSIYAGNVCRLFMSCPLFNGAAHLNRGIIADGNRKIRIED